MPGFQPLRIQGAVGTLISGEISRVLPLGAGSALGVNGVLTEDGTAAIKMQITGKTGNGLDLPFISLDNTVSAPAKTCGSTHLRHNNTVMERAEEQQTHQEKAGRGEQPCNQRLRHIQVYLTAIIGLSTTSIIFCTIFSLIIM